MEAFISPTLVRKPLPAQPDVRPAEPASSGISPLPDGVLFGSGADLRLARNPIEKAAYWRGFIDHGSAELIANVRVQTGIVAGRSHSFPLTVTERSDGNAYTASLRAQYVAYPLAELGLVESLGLQRAARAGLRLLNLALIIGQVDKLVQWNSWLLSTNLIPAALLDSVGVVTQRLVEQFPNHAILLKNVNDREYPGLPVALERAGYDLMVSRQVYFFDGRAPGFLQKSTVKRDRKFLKEQKDYRVMEHAEFRASDVPRVANLYSQLYLEKHSRLNPQYTERFVAGAIRERWLELRGLRHSSGRIDAVMGCFRLGGTTSTPFIGYDTRLPQEAGLYRILVSVLLERVAEEKLLLNYSSGAGDFKRRRGGEPVMEYNAVCVRHLPARRRAVFALLRELSNRFGRRFLEENKI